jgi:HSP20 family protein
MHLKNIPQYRSTFHHQQLIKEPIMNTLVRLNSRLNPAYAALRAGPAATRLDDLLASYFAPATNDGAALDAIKIDVSEDANGYQVSANLAGVKKENIHVSVEKNQVSISAEIKREVPATEGARVLHSELFYGKAERSFTLAQDIDEAHIQAKFVDGVLNLTLPKKVATAAKRVTIE